MTTTLGHTPEISAYRHEALFYSGGDEFLDRALPFLFEGISQAEPALVVVNGEKIAALRDGLGESADAVTFADMEQVGVNPARIIPLWNSFIRQHAGTGTRLRGIGEPIWAARTRDELAECHQHEALLNGALAGHPLWLVCPYNASSLGAADLARALRNHPFVSEGGVSHPSATYAGDEALMAVPDEPLPEPTNVAYRQEVTRRGLPGVRSGLTRWANDVGLSSERTADFVVAANEVATNSVTHGGGRGDLRAWYDERSVVCEVRDRGHIEDPMVDRARPDPRAKGGRGLWLANHLCELVQIRSGSSGSVVRLHMRLD